MQTSKSMDVIRAECINRIELMFKARDEITKAKSAILQSHENMLAAWDGWPDSYTHNARQIESLALVTEPIIDSIDDRLRMGVEQAAFLIARDVIAPVAQQSTEPVVALTGNSYMPPIRDISEVERIWQADEEGEFFAHFIERLESELDRNNVMMSSPDYDNMLYVIDTSRWTFVGEENEPNGWLDQSAWSAIRD